MNRLTILEKEICKQRKEPFISRYLYEGLKQKLREERIDNLITLYYFLSLRPLIHEAVGAMYLDNSEEYISNSIVAYDSHGALDIEIGKEEFTIWRQDLDPLIYCYIVKVFNEISSNTISLF